ncbi:MAG: PAS domain S-box protein [Bacteroidales bacterium]
MSKVSEKKPTGNELLLLRQEIDRLKEEKRKLAEENLHYKRLYNLFDAVIRNIPDMIWAKDLDKKYILANEEICRKLLHVRDTLEPIGKTDLFFAERERNSKPEIADWHTFGEICSDSDTAVMESKKSGRFDEFGNIRGEFLYLDVHKAPLYNQDNEMIGTVGIARDVTREKETARKLTESEEKYRRIFENSSDPILVLENGRFADCNDAALKAVGFKSKAGIVGKQPADISPELQPDGQPSAEKAAMLINKAFEQGHTRFEWLHQDKKHNPLWVNVSLTVLPQEGKNRIFTIWRDISDQKKTEQALAQSEKKYRDLFELSPEPAVIINKTGFITDCNQIFYESSRMQSDDIIGKHFTQLPIFSARDLPRYIRIFSDMIRHKSVQNYEYIWTSRDGKVHNSIAHIAPLFEEKKLQGFMAVTRDITEQRMAEEKIRESEKKYRLLFERANDAILLMKDGVIMECNEQTFEMFGCRREEIIGKPPSSFSPEFQPDGTPSDELAAKKIMEALKAGSSIFEWKHIKPDGTRFDAEVNLSRLHFGNTILLQAIVRDISYRKTAEQKLRESEERYKLLANASREAIFVTREGYCLEVNQTATRMFGYSYEEFIGEYGTQIIAPESREITRERMLSDYDRTYEAVGIRKNGTRFPIEIQGRPFTYQGEPARLTVCRDLTMQKLAEREIKEITNRLFRAEKVAKIGNWEFHLHTNKVITSAGAKLIYGLDDRNNLTIPEVQEVVLPEYRMEKDDALRGLIDNGTPYNVEFKIRRPSDNKIVDIQSIAEYDSDRGVVFGIIRDITERKMNENTLKKAKEQAEESDRLKTVFLGTMSHELRTPLNSIIGFSEIMDESMDKYQILDFAKTIHKNGNHLLSLIEDMFDISMIETGEFRVEKSHFSLRDFLSEIRHMLREELQQQQKMHLEISMSYDYDVIDSRLYADKSKLRQIFINLIKNAVKFTPQGKIEIGFTQSDPKNLTFFVKDTGIGIPFNKRSLIFERFRQVEESDTRKYGGTGLGLYICKSLVNKLNGKIWIESAPGRGSTFYFTIPELIDARANGNHPSQQAVPPEVDFRDKTIIVAEDEDSNYMLVESILGKTGARLLHAENGAVAIDLLKEHPGADMILMDIKMPLMGGMEATREIRTFNTKIPIIALTAYAMKGDREKYLAADFNEYIAKPMKRETLLETLSRQFNRK